VPPSNTLRIVDANINRLGEGLRVLEEIARFLLNDSALSSQLKAMRHELGQSVNINAIALLSQRNAGQDVGGPETPLPTGQPDVSALVRANARRVEESLRVLEELAKLPENSTLLDSFKVQKARFAIYTIEKQLVSSVLRTGKKQLIHGLYAIIDAEMLRGRDAIQTARQLIKGGARIIQLRNKTSSAAQILPVAHNLAALCRDSGVLFIVNDYLEIALEVNSDGLHLGQSDLPVTSARKHLPIDCILGHSVLNEKQAMLSQEAGADYVAVGAVFRTPTKTDAEIAGLAAIRKIRESVSIPVVAIGGINLNNIKEVVDAGADAIAMISAIIGQLDITSATRQLIDLIETSLQSRGGIK
jgi:thiamine-phosphate pyrophosphorylase